MRILWNSKYRNKEGEYRGKISHHSYAGPQLALVKLDGNKRLTRVRLEDLSFLDVRYMEEESEYDKCHT